VLKERKGNNKKQAKENLWRLKLEAARETYWKYCWTR